jgi:LacI family transcriptional regulator
LASRFKKFVAEAAGACGGRRGRYLVGMGGEARRRVTSHDIARVAGVSQPTVSRALRGDPRVAAQTTKVIEEAAARLGYRPHAAARSLITSRSSTAGIVVSDLGNPFYTGLVEALHERLERLGYRAILFNEATGGAGSGEVIAMMESGVIDGALVATVTADGESMALLSSAPGPVVLVVRELPGWEGDAVVADNRAGAGFAARFLHRLGHRLIATIDGPADTSTATQRAEGFEAALAAEGGAVEPRLRREAPFTFEGGRAACAELLALEPPPTAIFCGNDLVALGALDMARKLGVPVPDRLSIVGFDDIDLAAWSSFRLTTIRQPLREMAARAATLLTERIEGGEPQRVVYPVELVRRDTAAAPSGDD